MKTDPKEPRILKSCDGWPGTSHRVVTGGPSAANLWPSEGVRVRGHARATYTLCSEASDSVLGAQPFGFSYRPQQQREIRRTQRF